MKKKGKITEQCFQEGVYARIFVLLLRWIFFFLDIILLISHIQHLSKQYFKGSFLPSLSSICGHWEVWFNKEDPINGYNTWHWKGIMFNFIKASSEKILLQQEFLKKEKYKNQKSAHIGPFDRACKHKTCSAQKINCLFIIAEWGYQPKLHYKFALLWLVLDSTFA